MLFVAGGIILRTDTYKSITIRPLLGGYRIFNSERHKYYGQLRAPYLSSIIPV